MALPSTPKFNDQVNIYGLLPGIQNSISRTDLIRLHDGYIRLRDSLSSELAIEEINATPGYYTDRISSLRANIELFTTYINAIEEVLGLGPNSSRNVVIIKMRAILSRLKTEHKLTSLRIINRQSIPSDRGLDEIFADIRFVERLVCLLLQLADLNVSQES